MVSSSHDSCTLHSLFSIPRGGGSWEELASYSVSQSVIDKFAGVTWLIIDEFTFISCSWFQWLNLTLGKISNCQESSFGVYNCCLFGDVFQILSIGRNLLSFESDCDNEFSRAGCALYKKEFTKAFFLDGNQRACKEDKDFRRILSELRRKELSPYSLGLLQSRLLKNLPDSEISEFADAIALFQLNKEVKSFNDFKLRSLGKPILTVKPIITPLSAAKKFSGLKEAEDLLLAEGCKLMLVTNINTSIGLSSGSFCRFVRPFYAKPDQPLEYPDALLVRFDKPIKGPTLKDNVVPIFRNTESFLDPISGTRYRIKQYPLRNSYGITHHRWG